MKQSGIIIINSAKRREFLKFKINKTVVRGFLFSIKSRREVDNFRMSVTSTEFPAAKATRAVSILKPASAIRLIIERAETTCSRTLDIDYCSRPGSDRHRELLRNVTMHHIHFPADSNPKLRRHIHSRYVTVLS